MFLNSLSISNSLVCISSHTQTSQTKVFQQHRNVKYHLLWPGYSEEQEGYKEARSSTERSDAAADSRVFTQIYLAAEVLDWLDSFFNVGPAQLSLWVLLQEKAIQSQPLAVGST